MVYSVCRWRDFCINITTFPSPREVFRKLFGPPESKRTFMKVRLIFVDTHNTSELNLCVLVAIINYTAIVALVCDNH